MVEVTVSHHGLVHDLAILEKNLEALQKEARSFQHYRNYMPKIGKLIDSTIKDFEGEVEALKKLKVVDDKALTSSRRKSPRKTRKWGSKKKLAEPPAPTKLKRSAAKTWRVTRIKMMFVGGNKVVQDSTSKTPKNIIQELDSVEHDAQAHPLEDLPLPSPKPKQPLLSKTAQEQKDRDDAWERQQALVAKSDKLMTDFSSGLEAAGDSIGMAQKSKQEAEENISQVEAHEVEANPFSTREEDKQKLDELLKAYQAKSESGGSADFGQDPKTWGISTAAPVCEDGQEQEAGLIRRQVQENHRVYNNEQRKRQIEEKNAKNNTFKPQTNSNTNTSLPPLKRNSAGNTGAFK